MRNRVPTFPRMAALAASVVLSIAVSGCTSTEVYLQSVGKFQTATGNTIKAVQPYFVQLNSVEAELQLYGAVMTEDDWGIKHLKTGLPPETIAVRLQALKLISDYANLLGDLVASTWSKDLESAAATLGKNAQDLAKTIGTLADKDVPDIGTPLSSLVKLIGKTAIEHKRRKAVEEAILDGEKHITTIVEKLRKDLKTAIKLRQEQFTGMIAARLKLYNEARKKATPEKMQKWIDEIVAMKREHDALQSIPYDVLFTDMGEAHQALVKFARSDKWPKDLAELVSRIEVFAANAALVVDTIEAVRSVK